MNIDFTYPAIPSAVEVEAAGFALSQVQAVLARSSASGSVQSRAQGDGVAEMLQMPRFAIEVLSDILRHIAKGEGVAILPMQSELSTQRAADLLNVSRPYLIKLLDSGHIEYRLVGKHRRIPARSLLAYKRADDAERDAAAGELTTLGQEMDLSQQRLSSRHL